MTNIANLTRTVVDPLLETVHGGIGGLFIALVLGRMPASGLNPTNRYVCGIRESGALVL